MLAATPGAEEMLVFLPPREEFIRFNRIFVDILAPVR